jgi:pyridoxal/pyridoxine/pyridoxamine kinase
MAKPEYKETTYSIRTRADLLLTGFLSWKTAGAAWKGSGFAPKWLLEYMRDWRNVRINNLRYCDDYICGEVTVRRPITRMGAYLRRRRANGEG